jgi:Flp pilus assembly pilin Flp
MIKFIRKFGRDEDGAVTVDWVVLTALIVGLIAAAFSNVEGGVAGLTADIQAYLEGIDVGEEL